MKQTASIVLNITTIRLIKLSSVILLKQSRLLLKNKKVIMSRKKFSIVNNQHEGHFCVRFNNICLCKRRPVVRQKKSYAAKNQCHVNEVAFIDRRREMRESIRKFELVHAPGLAQLDVSPAQVFVHVAIRNEKSAEGEFEEVDDLTARTW